MTNSSSRADAESLLSPPDPSPRPSAPPESAANGSQHPDPRPATPRPAAGNLPKQTGGGNGNGEPGAALPPGVAANHAPLANLAADEQPTVITPRPSPPGDPSASEAISRILHGRILPGERLGHFELLEFVGGGGMGKVFRARDTRLARSVALKILMPEHAADQETVLRFQNEAQSAARLDHENIARVYYVGEDRGLHYIVFEFIEGVNVRDLVAKNGPLPLAEAVSYTLQVAEALTHASARNVVHRDIKPSNLLITPSGQAKLIDMGLARLREVDSPADLTASGVTLGTFDYISPEQARDPRSADVRSDIYSLGCTFFYMLTGRPPFVGGTMLQKLLQHQGDQPPEVREFRADVPEEVHRILRRMLAKDPARRYATAAELVDDLLAVARAVGLRPLAPGARRWTVPGKPAMPYYYRHLPWVVSIAALLAIVFFLDRLWPYLPGPAAPPPSTFGREAGDSRLSPSASGKGARSESGSNEGRAAEGRRSDILIPSPTGRGAGDEGVLGAGIKSDDVRSDGKLIDGPLLQPSSPSAAPPAASPDLRSALPPAAPLNPPSPKSSVAPLPLSHP